LTVAHHEGRTLPSQCDLPNQTELCSWSISH